MRRARNTTSLIAYEFARFMAFDLFELRDTLHGNPEQPKVFGVKFDLREIGRIFFPLKYGIFSLGNVLIIRFQVSRGVIIFKL